MKILLLEDDYLAAEDLLTDIREAFPGLAEDDILHLSTEAEFQKNLNAIVKSPPRAAIFDVMVRWTNPEKRLKKPPIDVKELGPWRAGLRCAALLRERNADVPILLYSVLEAEDLGNDLPLNTILLSKAPTSQRMIDELRKIGLK